MTESTTQQDQPVQKVRVLLADDHTILRSGLRMLLESNPAIEVIGEAADGVEAIKQARELGPDLVIMDVTMPRIDGLAATTEIKRVLPTTKILILSMNEGDEFLFKALKAGGSGYVYKRAAEAELHNAIKEVMRGGTYVREAMQQRLVQDALERWEHGDNRPVEELTPREKEVLALIASGLTNQEIADKLVISVRTVETHRSHIIDKLGIRKRSELVNYALRKGLVE
ncbi:MAG: response regulator transcription factor [Candidatus Sericytochromatia bacterium]|nr:response regulator transcription factor [Candidatus Tanganyikabacteria bacterium]